MDARTRRIARQRIQTLFSLANEIVDDDQLFAQRYVYLARRIAMAARLHLPEKYRHQICRHCKSFVYPGVNCRVRLQQKREPHIVITCLNCGNIMRMPLRKRREMHKP